MSTRKKATVKKPTYVAAQIFRTKEGNTYFIGETIPELSPERTSSLLSRNLIREKK
jgi:hypothetical protein